MVRVLQDLHDPLGENLQLHNEKVTAKFRRRYRLNEIGDKHPGRKKHLSAIQIKYILGDAEFTRCLKFSLVRNPWARMVSRYFFTHVDSEPTSAQKQRRDTSRKFHNLDFESWIRRRWRFHKLGIRENNQLSKLVNLDGQILVDHVGRLESAQDTLDWMMGKLGAERIAMPHVNGTRKGHYAQFYNRNTMEMVEQMCRVDIEYFNYRFEE